MKNDSFLVTVTVIVAGVIGGLMVARTIDTNSNEERARKTVQAIAQAKDDVVGFPAGPAQLEDGDVYRVKMAFVDEWPDQTNFTAVLQKVRIMDAVEYRHARTDRFFTLPWNLEPGYYLFARGGGTNWSYLQIPPPEKPEKRER